MTRVLWLIKGLGPGGAERLLVSLAGALDQERTTCMAAYLLPWKDHLVPELAAKGVPAVCLSNGRLWDPRWVWRLVRLVRRERIDVVHIHSPLLAAIARVPLRLLGRRRPAIVYTEHNNWASYGRPTRALHRLTFRLDDADVAVSADAQRSIPPRLRRDVEILIHGVPIDALRAHRAHRSRVRTALGLTDDEIVAITVANYRADKDYPTLLNAAATVIAHDGGSPAWFLTVGQGPLEADVRALHGRLGLGDRVRLLGYRDDVPDLLAAADLFVLSSTVEGYPVALMEALAIGLPVVATAVGGVKVAVRDGRDGILVPPGDPARLAEAITEVVRDPDRRAGLARSAAARGEDYSITRSAARLTDLYDEVRPARSA